MTLTDLRYVLALARERHFGRAAERCFVAQPTLSVAVKKLEEELGVLLFERALGDIRLTPAGERIVAQAERVLNEAKRIKELAQECQDPLLGPLRLGAIYTIGPYLLPRLVPVLHERVPHMPLLLEENFTHKLAEKLSAGELDVIIIALPFTEPGIVTQVLYDEPLRVVVPRRHPWSERERIAARELESEELLILGAGNCFRDQVLEVCPSSQGHSRLQRTMEGSSLETIRYMVAGGIGITVLPSSATDDQPSDQALIAIRPFHDPEPCRRVALAWRASFPRPQAIEQVRQAILACQLPGVYCRSGE